MVMTLSSPFIPTTPSCSADPNALRKVCAALRWKIISDGASADHGTLAIFEKTEQ
jgi:hypothetical protein